MKNFSQIFVKNALCGVVGSERIFKRVWETSQQAKSVRQAVARTGRFTEMGTRFLCLLLLSRIIDNRSYHDFFGITTFDHKAGKLKEFLKKVGIIFCNRHQFLVFETDNISLKVGITFFSECVKSAILLKNEFSHFAFLNKSSIFNGLSKRLSRLFTAIASLEEFINGRKVTHIITTFFRGNGANTTFLIKSHDTKKVGITILVNNS